MQHSCKCTTALPARPSSRSHCAPPRCPRARHPAAIAPPRYREPVIPQPLLHRATHEPVIPQPLHHRATHEPVIPQPLHHRATHEPVIPQPLRKVEGRDQRSRDLKAPQAPVSHRRRLAPWQARYTGAVTAPTPAVETSPRVVNVRLCLLEIPRAMLPAFVIVCRPRHDGLSKTLHSQRASPSSRSHCAKSKAGTSVQGISKRRRRP